MANNANKENQIWHFSSREWTIPYKNWIWLVGKLDEDTTDRSNIDTQIHDFQLLLYRYTYIIIIVKVYLSYYAKLLRILNDQTKAGMYYHTFTYENYSLHCNTRSHVIHKNEHPLFKHFLL